MLPDVSVIIPAYNTQDYIAKAIDSALAQTLTNIEVIVVDDASSDRTLEVIHSIRDPRLHVLQNQQNLGVSASRNLAIQQARGEWIAVLDSDDWYAPERLELLLEIAQERQADLVIDDLNLIQNNESVPWGTLLQESGAAVDHVHSIEPIFYVKSGLYGEQALQLGLCKPLFRRAFLNQHHLLYDENLRVVEDFHLVLRCLIHSASMFFVPNPYYFYRSRPGSLVTGSRVRHLQQFQEAILDVIHQDAVQRNTELLNALSESLMILIQNEHYYNLVESLKHKSLVAALIAAIQHPYACVQLIKQLPLIVWRRYRYYIRKDKLVYEIAYRNN